MDYISECKEIYLSAFEDDGAFCNSLFEICKDNIEYIDEDGKVVSFLFSLPCEIEGKKAKYIFAAATKKEQRGNGYMSGLLERVKEKENLLFLRPATEKLIEFYKKAGFTEITASATHNDLPCLKPKDSFLQLANKTERDIENEYPFMCFGKELEFDKIFFEYSMD